MAQDKDGKICCGRWGTTVVVLLALNTFFLGAIFMKMCCAAKSGICPVSAKGSGYVCPYSKGSMKGSVQGK